MINKVSSIAVWNSKIIFIAVISIAAPAVIAGFMRSEARDSGAQNTPPLLELKNTINTDAFPMSLVVKDKTIYTVNANGNTLQIFQYIKKQGGRRLGSAVTDAYPISIAVSGRYAYVVSYISATLQIFDIYNEKQPKLITAVPTNAYPFSVTVSGGYAYVVSIGNPDSKLEIFNVSNPFAPQKVTSVLASNMGAGAQARSVAVYKNYIYVANYAVNSVDIFDVSDLSNPIPVGLITAKLLHPMAVAVKNDLAYVANYGAGSLEIYDVSDPTLPKWLGTAQAGVHPWGVAVAGKYAFVTLDVDSKLAMFDIADPYNPTKVGEVSTGATPAGVFANKSRVYVAAGRANAIEVYSY